MILKSLTLRNFKAVGNEPVTIEFKPITLLFGPNSAGKSTIIQALHYAREIFVERNPNPDRTAIGGQSVDLGGFLSLVHDHDRNRNLVLRFDLESSGFISADEMPLDQSQYRWERLFHDITTDEEDEAVIYAGFVLEDAKSAWVEVEVSWSQLLNAPVVNRYQVGLDGRQLAEITSSSDGKQSAISFLDIQHPRLVEDAPSPYPASVIDTLIRPEYLGDLANMNLLLDQRSALPEFGRMLPLAGEIFEGFRDEETLEASGNNQQILAESSYFRTYLSGVIMEPGHVLRDFLENVGYLGPLREIPTRDFRSPLTPDLTRGASGLSSWDYLHEADPKFTQELNQWLSQEDRLNAGYRIEVRRFRELDEGLAVRLQSGLADDIENLQEVLRDAPSRVRVVVVDQRRNLELQAADIGIGISQVVPVVVEALRTEGHLLAIEQPELHIHPAFQVALADLFIAGAKERKAVYLLETHSEHLMLRLQRRIRETTEGTLPPGAPSLIPDDLSIIFLDQTSDGSLSAYSIRVDEDGDFIDRWPKGFFPERFEEHYG